MEICSDCDGAGCRWCDYTGRKIVKKKDLCSIRINFEKWCKYERGQSVDRYDTFPYSYKISEVESMWVGWLAGS